MKLLNRVKQNFAKIAAFGALLVVGNFASAQQSPKSDTTIKKTIKPKTLESTTTDNRGRVTEVRYNESYQQQKKADKDQSPRPVVAVAPPIVAAQQPVKPGKTQAQKQKEYDNYWQKQKKLNNWTDAQLLAAQKEHNEKIRKILANKPKKKAATVVTQPTPVAVEFQQVDNITVAEKYVGDSVYVKDSIVRYVYVTDTIEKRDTVCFMKLNKSKWEVYGGVIAEKRLNATPIEGAAALNNSSNLPPKNVYPGWHQGYNLGINTPSLSATGFGSHVRGIAEIRWFPKQKGKSDSLLVRQNIDEANPGASTGVLYDAKYKPNNALDNARLGVEFFGTLGQGHRVTTTGAVRFGGYFQKRLGLESLDQTTARVTPEERQIEKNLTKSLFAEAAITTTIDLGQKKDQGFAFRLNANATTTSQGIGFGTSVSGFTHGGSKVVVGGQVGLVYRFKK